MVCTPSRFKGARLLILFVVPLWFVASALVGGRSSNGDSSAGPIPSSQFEVKTGAKPTVVPAANTFQFSSAGYSANEGDGIATITVTRSGDTSTAATVDYASSDGTASERSDYTTALGTLRFAAGEASKTFIVLIIDDASVENNESINLTLSN